MQHVSLHADTDSGPYGSDAKSSHLVPTDFMTHETKWLLQALEQAHFEKVNVNDLNASLFIEEFLNNLDKRKLFFTKITLERFISSVNYHMSFE